MNNLEENAIAITNSLRAIAVCGIGLIAAFAVTDAATIGRPPFVWHGAWSVIHWLLRAMVCAYWIVILLRHVFAKSPVRINRKLICCECRRVIQDGAEPIQHGLCPDPACYEARNEP